MTLNSSSFFLSSQHYPWIDPAGYEYFRTRLGLNVRAVTQNRNMAACCSLLSTMMTSWHGILIMRALIGLSLSGVAAVGMTYLAPTRVNLALMEERWPDVKFRATREHH